MNLLDLLNQSRRTFAQHPALIMRIGYRTVTLTYEQVYERAHQTASFLAAQGVGKGDCVVVCAPNSPYWICLFWGCLLRGALIVPLNTQSTDQMIEKILNQTEAKLFFTSRSLRHAVIDKPTFAVELLDELIVSYAGQSVAAVQPVDDDLVQILYTSGTTGEPKGVMLTHANLVANVSAMTQLFKLRPLHERILSILPLSHILEQTVGFLVPFSCGATIVYAHSHAAIASLLKEFCITKMIAVPEFLKILMARIMAKVREGKREAIVGRLMALSSYVPWWWARRLLFYPILRQLGGCLTVVASGGAPLDPELETQWNALGIQVLQGYGLTETSPVVASNTFTEHRPGSVGRVVPGVSVRLAADGEVQVKGPSVFQGYFKNEQKTREVFTDDGWFMTGDVGEFDRDGFLFIKGRKKYMIKGAGAQNVYPEDIEEALNHEPVIKDCCVLGIDQPGGAVQIHAVMLLREQLPADKVEALIHEVNERLASYQRIGGWTVWPEDDFPRSATRKIKKEEVKAFLQTREKKTSSSDEVSKTKSRLIELVSQLTGMPVDSIMPTTLLVRQLHMDSLMIVELLARIEDSFGVTVDGWIIGPTTTVAQVQEWIDHGAPAAKPVSLKVWPRFWWARMLRVLLQPVLTSFTRLVTPIRVEGFEHLKSLSYPVIFMPNHVSLIDPFFVLAALPAKVRRRISFAAAYDVLYQDYRWLVPLAELFFYAFPFPRKETENINHGLMLVGQALDHGYSVVVFPEGKISESGQLLPLKQGTGLIASQMMVTVVPVALFGVRKVVRVEQHFPHHRGVVTVRFGKPITIGKSMPVAQATDVVDEAMRKLLSS